MLSKRSDLDRSNDFRPVLTPVQQRLTIDIDGADENNLIINLLRHFEEAQGRIFSVTWDRREEIIFVVDQLRTLILSDLRGPVFHEKVKPFLRSLNSHRLNISRLFLAGMQIEDVHGAASMDFNPIILECSLRNAKHFDHIMALPFFEQWRNDQSCKLGEMRLSFNLKDALTNGRAYFENDDRFQALWNGDLLAKNLPHISKPRYLDGIYVFRREFQVDDYGREAVLLFFDAELILKTVNRGSSIGATLAGMKKYGLSSTVTL